MLLFALVIIGLSLFMLLMICVIVTCIKRKNINQNASMGPAINILQRRISSTGNHSVSSKLDRKAMIQDTSSEMSEESETVPYFRKVK